MKNAVIFHGMDCSPESFWYPYVKRKLEKIGYRVWVPELPNSAKADLKEWLPFVLENGRFDQETVLIGHSAGSPLILSLLESIEIKVKQVILVAGFAAPLKSKKTEAILQPGYNWEKIKQQAESFVFINSDNDPWKCDDKAGRQLFQKLGGTLIVRHGEGHMGSDTYHQPYPKFPLIVSLVNLSL